MQTKITEKWEYGQLSSITFYPFPTPSPKNISSVQIFFFYRCRLAIGSLDPALLGTALYHPRYTSEYPCFVSFKSTINPNRRDIVSVSFLETLFSFIYRVNQGTCNAQSCKVRNLNFSFSVRWFPNKHFLTKELRSFLKWPLDKRNANLYLFTLLSHTELHFLGRVYQTNFHRQFKCFKSR